MSYYPDLHLYIDGQWRKTPDSIAAQPLSPTDTGKARSKPSAFSTRLTAAIGGPS